MASNRIFLVFNILNAILITTLFTAALLTYLSWLDISYKYTYLSFISYSILQIAIIYLATKFCSAYRKTSKSLYYQYSLEELEYYKTTLQLEIINYKLIKLVFLTQIILILISCLFILSLGIIHLSLGIIINLIIASCLFLFAQQFHNKKLQLEAIAQLINEMCKKEKLKQDTIKVI